MNFKKIAILFIFGLTLTTSGFAAPTQLKWFGHSAFEIITPQGHILLIDPWLHNPTNPEGFQGKDPLSLIKKVDYILITHGHFDHVGDSVAIAKKTGAHLVANYELATNMVRVLDYPESQIGYDTLMNIGGEIKLANGEVSIFMTPAVHSSSLDPTEPDLKDQPLVYGGNPAGFVIKIKNGPTIYDSGDTAYFSDMKLIGETNRIDVALINIGGHFGMEPPMAARAAAAVKAKLVIPQHYKTMPILTQDPKEFFQALDSLHIAHLEMKPGSTLTFEGVKPIKLDGKSIKP